MAEKYMFDFRSRSTTDGFVTSPGRGAFGMDPS
jgi:hypothetical protein